MACRLRFTEGMFKVRFSYFCHASISIRKQSLLGEWAADMIC